MQTPPTTEPEAAVAPAVDKSRFKFQKLLQPFTIERGIATPIIFQREIPAIVRLRVSIRKMKNSACSRKSG